MVDRPTADRRDLLERRQRRTDWSASRTDMTKTNACMPTCRPACLPADPLQLVIILQTWPIAKDLLPMGPI